MDVIISEMYAFIVKDPETQDEGVIGFLSEDGWVPLVGADLARVNSLRPVADEIVKSIGTTYKIKHFVYVDDLE